MREAQKINHSETFLMDEFIGLLNRIIDFISGRAWLSAKINAHKVRIGFNADGQPILDPTWVMLQLVSRSRGDVVVTAFKLVRRKTLWHKVRRTGAEVRQREPLKNEQPEPDGSLYLDRVRLNASNPHEIFLGQDENALALVSMVPSLYCYLYDAAGELRHRLRVKVSEDE